MNDEFAEAAMKAINKDAHDLDTTGCQQITFSGFQRKPELVPPNVMKAVLTAQPYDLVFKVIARLHDENIIIDSVEQLSTYAKFEICSRVAGVRSWLCVCDISTIAA